MASLDAVSIAILLGAVLVMAGILSSLLALRFGAPLLLVFLLIGMLAGDAGPGQIQFDDVRTTYLVGSVALALILFDGGLKTRFQSIRTVLAPSMVLATIGVLLTALITAPVARYVLELNWTESLLVGAVVASTDAAAVFLLVHTQGLRLRPRVGATLEAESGTNDPFAIFLTLMLVEFISSGQSSLAHIGLEFAREAALGAIIGVIGGRLVVLALNKVALPQGLHAPFVTTAALVIFGAAQIVHGSGFLAVYLAGIIIGNRPTRAHNSVVTFLDAATWLAQIVMFVLLGLLVSPNRLLGSVGPAVIVALTLMLLARPVAVFLCLAPFRFNWREKVFIAWVGLRGAVAIFLASIPMLVGLSKAYLYFDVAFVVVITSLLLQGWTLAPAARRLHVALPRADRGISLSGAVSLQLAGKDLHCLDRPARRGCDLSGVDPAAGRAVKSLSLFRCRLCRRHHLAVAAGLDAGARRKAAARRAAARRPRPAPRRARPARSARAATGRLSRAFEKPLYQARADPVVVEADLGDPRPTDSLADRGRSDRGRRLHLSAGAAGKGRGAGSLLCRHGAEHRARPASAWRLHGVRRAHAGRTGRDLRREGG